MAIPEYEDSIIDGKPQTNRAEREMALPPSAGSAVDHPRHYNAHPSGVECITVVEHMGFNLGNAIKYLWRADEKGAPIQDLEKAAWYIAREIERRKQLNNQFSQSGEGEK